MAAQTEPQWKVAVACGIHPTALSLYVAGKRVPHARHALALAEYFGVTPGQILDRDPLAVA